MSNGAKLTFSEFEAKLVNNSEWILTKHAIIQKVSDLLWTQVPAINECFIAGLPEQLQELTACRPKISRGERYRDLPWVILDYPAVFSKTNIFALRTMFLWGNFVSVTLHLSGSYKNLLHQQLAHNLNSADRSFFISTGASEWEHHFEADNYTALQSLPAEDGYKKLVQPSFIKIALKYDL
ncbi:MAG: hypothetical protein EOO03_15700, partial [Chitinophagaceae bacterium]